ncbi:uncharacterized protein AUP68_00757 [Ilyonectria robusta]
MPYSTQSWGFRRHLSHASALQTDQNSVAGSESTSITLTYLFWLLIKHPDIQRRLRVELQTVPQEDTGAYLASLPFLDAVIKETLRIYPPAPSAMPRVVPPGGAEVEGVHYPPNVRCQHSCPKLVF